MQPSESSIGNEITRHVDISWNETWTGTKQKRIARFEGSGAGLALAGFAALSVPHLWVRRRPKDALRHPVVSQFEEFFSDLQVVR
jgi:hypothetical protein